ncbi:MAG: class I SAM-dependent methyltransferase [Methanomassiliicoccales archaeon]|nr:MAG: class I SAM-dependent methyltransferase [Methanomassiliicoccales archaeon]
MEKKYKLNVLEGKDIFDIIRNNRNLIDEYFWEYYENFTTKRLRTYVEDICDFFNPSGNVLSIGCGHGLNEILMSDMCQEVINIKGIDLVEFKIKSMNEIIDLLGLENVVGIHADGMKMDFSDEFFDTIIIIESLSHADNQHQMLKEAARVLKKKGAVFVLDFNNGANPRIWIRSWKQRHFEETIENIVNPYFIRNRLLKMGFKDIVIEPYRHGRSFGHLRRMMLSKNMELPSKLYLFVSKGFMLKGRKY